MNDEASANYRLANAEARHEEAPRSFFIPTRDEREALRPGDLAKLLFEVLSPTAGQPSGERMWVQVVSKEAGRYVGQLDNQPRVVTTIAIDDHLEFGPEHIIQLLGEPDPLAMLKVWVSRRAYVDDVQPRYVAREEPMDASDSGWCVMVGDETDDELNDPANVLVQSLGFVSRRWPDLVAVFTASRPAGEWDWDLPLGAYVPRT